MYKIKHVAEVYFTTSICHAVEEEPGTRVRAIFDKGNVVTGVDAEHSEQLHHVPGHGGISGCLCWHCQSSGAVPLPQRMGVHL